MEASVKVSIIIPCFNRIDRTMECWQALRETLDGSSEVIFVNNGSSDGTKTFLDQLQEEPHVVVIENAENAGFAQANNQAAARARGEFLVFLNNDTIPAKGWLEPMIEALTRDAKIGIVGSKLIYPDGRVQHAGIVVRERIEGKNQLVCDHIHRLSRHDAAWVNIEREFQAVTGACMALRREVFHSLGGFDQAFVNGYEDLDLCFRARAAGLRVVYCPRSVVVHHESSTQGRFESDQQNTALFTERWSARIASDENETYAAAGRPNLEEMRAELLAARQSLEKIVAPRSPDEGKTGLQKILLRWFGPSKMERNLLADVRAIRNTLVHLRRVTESMAMLLDEQEIKEPRKPEPDDRADQSLQ